MTTHKLNSERQNHRGLRLDELETIPRGDGKTTTKTSSGKGSSGQVYLRYDFTEVF